MLGQIINAIPQAVFWKDLNSVYLGCNGVFTRAVGFSTPAEIIGKTDFDLPWPQEEANAYRADDQEVMKTKRPKNHIIEQLTQADGKRLWIDTTKVPLFNKDGEVIGVLGIFEDITERKKIENALQQSEENLRLKLENILSPEVDILDQELSNIIDQPTIKSMLSDVTKLTNMAIAILDIKGKVLVATGWQDICVLYHRIHPEAAQNCLESDTFLNKNLQEGKYVAYQCKNGLWDVITPLILGNKHVGNIFTGQFFYDDDIVDSERFIRQAHQFHFNPEEYLAALERVPRLSHEKVNTFMDFLTKFSHLVSKLGFSNLKLARALSEQKKIEEERLVLESKLAQAQKMESIGRLAGGIAHDFNNLLAVIMGYSDSLLTSLPPDSPIRKDLSIIMTASSRAADLTKQLLAFSRKQTLDVKVVNISSVIKTLETMIKRVIGENIEIKIIDNIKNLFIKADASQIEQVLLNLCLNARDAMPDGGTLAVETGSFYADEEYTILHPELNIGPYVTLSVSDTGRGMNDETLRHIFEPFFTSKDKAKGTGLGLATAYGIVKQHGGGINVVSEAGKGSKFTVFLPQLNKEAAIEEQKASHLATKQGQGEIILVAEDDPTLRQLVCTMLSHLGYSPIEAKSTTECIELASQSEHIDLLLSDVIMPAMNGRQLYEKVAQIKPDIKVLYMSGFPDDVIAHHGLLDEGINLLPKPFSAIQLNNKIRMILDQKQFHH